jgi:cytochrome c oxidase assembly protein subunit 15
MTEAAVNLRDFRARTSSTASGAFQRLAWGSLVYTVFVILFGAVVRITGSGAGCGQHWPTCQGEVAHLPRSIETAIELTHRLTSGLSLLLSIGLLAFAFRRFEPGHTARRAAFATLVFMLLEALIGAALVLLALVGKNDSLARAGVMAAHLVNTSLLTGAMAITAWSARKPALQQWCAGRAKVFLFAGVVASMLLVSTSGAVTALGDTLYPVASAPGTAPAVDTVRSFGHEFLLRFRTLHPILAILVLAYLSYAIGALKTSATRRHARLAIGLLVVQMGAGVLNILLSAPAWMQVTHLGLATVLWITLVLLGAEALTADTAG